MIIYTVNPTISNLPNTSVWSQYGPLVNSHVQEPSIGLNDAVGLFAHMNAP